MKYTPEQYLEYVNASHMGSLYPMTMEQLCESMANLTTMSPTFQDQMDIETGLYLAGKLEASNKELIKEWIGVK